MGVTAVTGRLCSTHRVPSPSTAHSMSWAERKFTSPWKAMWASSCRRAGGSTSVPAPGWTVGPAAGEHVVLGHDLAAHQAVGSARHHVHREMVPVAGHRVHAEQHAAGHCLQLALHQHPHGPRHAASSRITRPEAITASTADRKRSHPRTSSTEVN